jgi:putative redox protein
MPVTAKLRWLGGHRLEASDEYGVSITLDSAAEGYEPRGFKPVALLLVSLAACVAYDVVEIMRKQRQQFTGLRIDVTGDQAPEPPWPFRRIHMVFAVSGRGLNAERIERAVELAETKYCAVSATIGPDTQVTTEVVLFEDEST